MLPSDKVTVRVGVKRVSTWIAVANDGLDKTQVPTTVDVCPRFSVGCEGGKCQPDAPRCLLTTLECTSTGFCGAMTSTAARRNALVDVVVVALSVVAASLLQCL